MPMPPLWNKGGMGKAIHTRMGKILQQPFGILLFEIPNDNSFGFDISLIPQHYYKYNFLST